MSPRRAPLLRLSNRNGQTRPYGRAWYDTPRWRRYRRIFINANPLCVHCKKEGHTQASHHVDHITPHEGDQELFWSRSNHQALCRSCHAKKSMSEAHKKCFGPKPS